MRKMMTKHGHEWLMPETVGEFQAAGINIDELCMLAGNGMRNRMNTRSSKTHKNGLKWNPDPAKMPPSGRCAMSPATRLQRLLDKHDSPALREAMTAVLRGEDGK